jgi:hypothetical protein
MRNAPFVLIATVAPAACAALAYYMGPGGTGVIGRLTLEDGSEFKVIQQYNGSFDPYTVDFFFKLPGSPWGWCYIEPEDTRWTSARLRYNAQKRSIEVYRGNTLRAAYSTDCKTFALYADYQREVPAPQEVRDPPL